MKSGVVLVSAVLGGTLLIGCAAGSTQDNNWQDTSTLDTFVDMADVDVPWDTVDSTVDPVLDPYSDAPLDPYADPLGDPFTDVVGDGVDVADTIVDTPVEDVAVDEAPATCTPADLVPQTMCGAGSKCTFTSVDTFGNPETFCDVAGAQGWNETCGSGGLSDNCQAGYMCLSSGGGGSRCRMFCSLDYQCQTFPGGTNAACEIGISVGGTSVTGVTTCSFHCDVLTQTGCDTGQGCRASFPDDYTYWSDCTTAASGVGCEAGTGSDCAAGWDCFNIDSDGDTVADSSECLEYCNYLIGSCSTVGTSCVQNVGWPSDIGVCFS